MLGIRVILIHFKRGNIDKETVTQMYRTYSKSGTDYTTAVMTLMDHPFLKYIDHYYVGTSITDGAERYVEANDEEVRKQYKSKNVVTISHNIMNYETFLQDETFDIVKKSDPNTIKGFYHNLLNSIEFDSDFQYKSKKYLLANPETTYTQSHKNRLLLE
jgi:hypothetical protein